MLTLVVFLLVLGVLVFIHELGHFLLAKRAGVRVEAFSFGFGPRLLGWKTGDTDYRICAIPLGGYVKMIGEDPKDEEADREDSFAGKSVGARMKIVVAGPLMNLALPFLLMPLVYLIGIDEPAYLFKPADVGWVIQDSPAQKAGFLPGDRIHMIQGEEIPDWERAKILFAANPDKRLEVEVLRGQSPLLLEVTPESFGPRGGYVGLLHDMPSVIGAVSPEMPAAEAGLEDGDRVVSIDGKPVTQWEQMAGIIRENPGKKLAFTCQRGEELLSADITPVPIPETEPGPISKAVTYVLEKIGYEKDDQADTEDKPQYGRVGIEYVEQSVFTSYGLWESIKNGFAQIGKIIALTFYVLGKLLTGGLSAKTLGGPILIAKMTGDAARVGLASLFSFMAFLSLQLGILNLLPIPVLDGGHVLFLSLEAILRRPVNVKVREFAQQLGFFLLLGFILYISYNDVMRLVP